MTIKNPLITFRTKVATASVLVVLLSLVLPSSSFLGRLLERTAFADTGTGSVSLTTVGTPASENFDTLSNIALSTTNTALPTGWYITETGGGARDNEQYAVDTGGSTTGDIYSYGAAAATERALGELRSGTLIPVFGAKFTNNTGATITSLDVSYTGEQWRFGGIHSTVADRLDFQYSLDATDLSTGTYSDANALDFNPPITTGTAGALNGNAAANRTAISSTITGLSIPGGATFFIRMNDVDATGADDGLSIDDFSITPQGAGGGGTSLSINDVTQVETNAGTTNFNFTVSLSAPAGAGGVTFDASTGDGTANAGSDFVGFTNQPFSIASGNTSTTVTVQVNGDGTPEANETFFVNITNIVGATGSDVQGLGTINNDDVTLIPIHNIQGNGSTSPLVSTSVSTTGIVTGLKSNGFFLQEPDASVDADPNTSEGIFVFTSSAPPAAAAIGNSVQVTATVQEFIPAADPPSPPTTELITPSILLLSTGNPLPAPIVITAAETTQASETSNPLDSLEEYEGMRVTVASLTVSGATQGTITEPGATVASSGVFIGVVTGVARPFREPGINISDPLPAGAPVTIPRFDENPQRVRVDSDAQPGTTAIDVGAGTIITNITGPLDYAFRCYTIDPDLATPPVVGVQPGSVPAPAATANEVTVASFNMERFFDTVDDPPVDPTNPVADPVLTTAAFNRRVAKASLIIRTVERYPDVIGVEEMEHLSTLQAVAAQINSDAVAIDALPNPNYTAYLVEGNDVGGIDVGFLVRQSRISVVDVTQMELPGCDHFTPATCKTYTNPNNGLQEIMNDRPPLVLRATCPRPGGGNLPFTVIVNHLRSLSGVDDNTVNGTGTVGGRIRAKRRAQAEDLANIIQARQVADPTELIITLGDMNAFNVNDGYVDSIGTIKGTPSPASQVTLASSDLVNPDLTDLIDTLPAAQQYSYNFDGNAQTLDHIILNHKALVFLTRFAYARNDSDFAVKNYESTNELRISDHDQPVAYFSLILDPTVANGEVTGRVTDSNGAPIAGAVVNLSGAQDRKFITDANGNYRFENVETGAFYTVRPSRAGYSFSPAERSFSQLGNSTEATFTGSRAGSVYPLDTPEYFVRQHYLDFLSREPDESGFNFWSDQILECGSDSACRERRTINVSAAYFLSIEFMETGGFVDGLTRASYGVRPQYAEFMPDVRAIAQDVRVGAAGWAQQLTMNKQAFLNAWVQRANFRAAYDGLTNSQYVDALISHTGVDFAAADRDALVDSLNSSGATRAEVLRGIAENGSFVSAKRNEMFVMMQYFGYLRRDPDAAGYAFWLNKLNQFNGNFERAEMVKAFIVSGEYRARFGR
jgi:predicted extracellular nuclease